MFFEDAVKTSTDKLKAFITISGFVLVIVGTVGLLLSELVWDGSSNRTVILAVVGLVGLVNLAFAHFGMRDVKAEGPGSV